MQLKRLRRSEVIGWVGALILLVSLFLPWFSTSCSSKHAAAVAKKAVEATCNPNSQIRGAYGDFTAWHTFTILDIVLVLACIAPFVLSYIIARGHDLTWRPGEVTMIVGMTAFVLIILNGIVLGRPGTEPHNVEISLAIGYLVGLIGAFLIGFGGFLRQARYSEKQPPGVM